MPPTRYLLPWVVGSTLALTAQAAAPPNRAPDVVETREERTSGPPLWVSASAVADPQTVLNWELLGAEGNDELRRDVEWQRQKLASLQPRESSPDLAVRPIPEAACERSIDLVDDRGGNRPSQSLVDLSRNSRAIFRGVLRAIDFGFAYGVPGSLLTVEIREVVKGHPERVGDRIFVDYPVAHFAIGPYRFCNAAKGFEPQVGDAILLFDYTGPIDGEKRLFAPRGEQVFFESGSGGLVLPERLKADVDLSGQRDLAGIVRAARERLQSGLDQ